MNPTTHQVPLEQPASLDQVTSLVEEIKAKNKFFKAACAQVILLNHKVEDAKARYDRARSDHRLSFRYSNRLKLTNLEGVRDQVYNYAVLRLHDIEMLQEQLQQLMGSLGL